MLSYYYYVRQLIKAMPKLSRMKRSDLQELHRAVAYELGLKQRRQAQPALANALSEARATGLLE